LEQKVPISRAATVGTGLIGAGWAACYAANGMEVTLFDVSAGILKQAEGRVRAWVDDLVAFGLADRARADAGLAALRATSVLSEAVRSADWIQESAIENLALKQALFRDITAACPAGAIVASSTSTLPISQIQVEAVRPERIVLCHPINPPHLMPGVEIFGSERTSPETVDAAAQFLAAIGKVPIRLKREVPGHVVNRLQFALFREAVGIVESGIADVKDVDLAVTAGLGLRLAMMGQFMVFQLGGGPVGLKYFLEQFRTAIRVTNSSLSTWTELTPSEEQILIDGANDEMSGKSYQDVTAWRDKTLVALLQLLRPYHGPAGARE